MQVACTHTQTHTLELSLHTVKLPDKQHLVFFVSHMNIMVIFHLTDTIRDAYLLLCSLVVVLLLLLFFYLDQLKRNK